MASLPTGETLFQPRDSRHTSSYRETPQGLPADLLGQSAARLRILALLYAFVFFMAGFFPALLFQSDRERLFGSVVMWAPGAIAIAMALTVAAVVKGRG